MFLIYSLPSIIICILSTIPYLLILNIICIIIMIIRLIFVGRDLELVLCHGTKRSFRSGPEASYENGAFVEVRLCLLVSIFVLASLG